MSTAGKRLTTFLGGGALLVLLLWFCNRAAVVREDTSPDTFDLGKLHVGSTVEFSAKFLVSSHKHPFDDLFDRMLKWAPQAWSQTLSRVHPKNFRKAPDPVDLSTLKPIIQTPAFIRVQKIIPEQRKEWYGGRPFVVLHLTLDTSQPGSYDRKVKLTLDRRKASLPIHFTVQERQSTMPKLLIATTPYQAYSTDSGSNFFSITKLLSSLPLSADYLNELPRQLEPYQVVLLADSVLARLNADDIVRLRSFVEKGGRLILACDAFMSGTVPKSNQMLTNYGLQVEDQDYGTSVTVTNLATDPLTRGIQRLQFWRPSLIQVTDGSKAKALALSSDGKGGFVAVARLGSGGEITVLTASLWWLWVEQFKTNSDNIHLMENILRHADRAR